MNQNQQQIPTVEIQKAFLKDLLEVLDGITTDKKVVVTLTKLMTGPGIPVELEQAKTFIRKVKEALCCFSDDMPAIMNLNLTEFDGVGEEVKSKLGERLNARASLMQGEKKEIVRPVLVPEQAEEPKE